MAGAASSSQVPATEDVVSVSQEKEQETLLMKKYGGVCPKKPPLIAKDNERAFFDSADWALCKQGSTHLQHHQLTRLQSLPPKLAPTPHHPIPARRASYAPSYEGTIEVSQDQTRRDRRTASMICITSETCDPDSPGPSATMGKDPE